MVLGLPGLKAPQVFEAWLFKIARNVCMDHQRRRLGWCRMFVAYEPEHDSVAEFKESDDDDQIDAMTRALRQLPRAQRELLKLAVERDRSYQELAQISGLSTQALKSRLFRARESLRRILGTPLHIKAEGSHPLPLLQGRGWGFLPPAHVIVALRLIVIV
jgi:RNA polymerase sigma-70 factor, ECF subfamily